MPFQKAYVGILVSGPEVCQWRVGGRAWRQQSPCMPTKAGPGGVFSLNDRGLGAANMADACAMTFNWLY
jgi:hypothetical protein